MLTEVDRKRCPLWDLVANGMHTDIQADFFQCYAWFLLTCLHVIAYTYSYYLAKTGLHWTTANVGLGAWASSRGARARSRRARAGLRSDRSVVVS